MFPVVYLVSVISYLCTYVSILWRLMHSSRTLDLYIRMSSVCRQFPLDIIRCVVRNRRWMIVIDHQCISCTPEISQEIHISICRWVMESKNWVRELQTFTLELYSNYLLENGMHNIMLWSYHDNVHVVIKIH